MAKRIVRQEHPQMAAALDQGLVPDGILNRRATDAMPLLALALRRAP
jgi:hypothetical protein